MAICKKHPGRAVLYVSLLLSIVAPAFSLDPAPAKQDTALLYALYANDFTAIKAALAAGGNPNFHEKSIAIFDGVKTDWFITPLDFLVSSSTLPLDQKIELLKAFKQRGADFNMLTAGNNSLLYQVLQPGSSFSGDPLLMAKALLENGCNPNLPNTHIIQTTNTNPSTGKTETVRQNVTDYLPFAVLNNNKLPRDAKLELIDLLGKAGADFNCRDWSNRPLWMLVTTVIPRNDWYDYFEALLKAGMDPNIKSALHFNSTLTVNGKITKSEYDLKNTLLQACLYPENSIMWLSGKYFTHPEKIKLIKLLSHYKADFNILNDQDMSALEILFLYSYPAVYPKAVPAETEELYVLLTSLGADITQPHKGGSGVKDLVVATYLPHYERLLLDALPKVKDLDAKSIIFGHGRVIFGHGTILHYAVAKGNMAIIKWLLLHGVSVDVPDDEGRTPIMELAGLLYWDPSPEERKAKVKTALEIIKLFVARKANLKIIGTDGYSLVAELANREHAYTVVKALVEAGADFQTATDEDRTPLAIAISGKVKETETFLRSKGAKALHASPVPVGNQSPIARAILEGKLDELKKFTKDEFSKKTIRLASGVPATPLHLAVEQATPGVMKQLLELGLDWNVPDHYGRSPLVLAVFKGDSELVGQLLGAGADANLVDKNGETPISWAISQHPELLPVFTQKKVPIAGDAIVYKAIYTNNVVALKSLGNFFEPTYDLAHTSSGFGRTELVDYIGQNSPKGEKSIQDLHADSLTTAETLRTYPKGKPTIQPVPQIKDGLETKRGNFAYVLTDWSPWLATLTSPPPPLKKYPVYISIPEDYDPAQPWGLLVSMLNPLSKNQYPHEAYQKMVKDHQLIWVGFDPYFGNPGIDEVFNGNTLESMAVSHEAYILAIVYAMLQHFPIDRSRIYLAGFSWGGRLTGEIVPRYPELFKGGIAVAGCFTTGGQALFGLSMDYSRKHVRMVFASADYDYNRQETWNGYNLFQKVGYPVVYFQEPMEEHTNISPQNFGKALDFLDDRTGKH